MNQLYKTQSVGAQLFSDDRQIEVVRIEQWLNWATRTDDSVLLALPMLQRGSVWTANKVVNLWDSLLRGMPVGSFTVSSLKSGPMRLLGEKKSFDKQLPPKESNGLSLLDGQQRTLAMCIGWPWNQEMDRRVWVDFEQEGVGGQPFCLRVTTRFQPFGFNPVDQSKPLALRQRREAREKFDQDTRNYFESEADFNLPLDKTLPYGSVVPLELRGLIKRKREEKDLDRWTSQTIEGLQHTSGENRAEVERRVRKFGVALERLFQMEIALVRINEQLLKDDESSDEQDAVEPSLVVLFERIANAGTRLSPSDYVFSLIKHRFAGAHNLVVQLHESETVASLLSANDLVMTAVRIAAATHLDEHDKPFPDNPTPSPREFNRMIRHRLKGGQEFLGGAVMPLLGRDTGPQERESLCEAFIAVQRVVKYDPTNLSDPGLPHVAFPLLKRQLVQILVFWVHQRLRSSDAINQVMHDIQESRQDILRFVLFWLLCVDGKEKAWESAGKEAFKKLREEKPPRFPAKEIADLFCEKELAIPVQHPDEMREFMCPKNLPTDQFIPSLWSERHNKKLDSPVSDEMRLARNWLFFRSNLLLWLQRAGIVKNPAYKHTNPLAGPDREQETLYDYDHITPRDDWGRDGRSSDALFRFCENNDASMLGDNIGNMRVLESRSNRSFGADSPLHKLRRPSEPGAPEDFTATMRDGDICDEEVELWKKCSPETMAHDSGKWNRERAELFKQVVEKRAFRLYKRFYDEGGFQVWEGARGC